MFRNRTNSQKPPDELLANFKASFPALRSTSASSGERSQGSASLTEALDVATTTRHFNDEHEIKDRDSTPRGNTDQWRFTPSVFDPNSYAFSSFANQPPGYYTPTPGGTNTLYHPQAGDLHTPGFTLGLGTPLSMPTSETTFQISHVVHAPIPSFTSPINTGIAPQVFQNVNPFAYHHPQPPQPQTLFHGQQPHQEFQQHQQHHDQHQQSLHSQVSHPPHRFSLPAVFEPFGRPFDESKLHAEHSPIHHNINLHDHSPVMQAGFGLQHADQTLQQTHAQAFKSLDSFRYHVTLNAPTAMIKSADEIPITYLNKGQAYTVVVVDTRSFPQTTQPCQYRTFVRVSFEDEQQRQRPAACWQLWKEGRGTNEAHHRGGRLQAVEFVDPGQTGGMDASSKPQIELESASFDGFSVLWTPAPNAPAECSIAVRFNFLSTDFSHSKGVKGIPVRLCAKTELKTPPVTIDPTEPEQAEVCFCKVKLFRDHGAERKLSNDIAHVKKSIDKLKQQIAQAEAGVGDSGKRKRSNSVAKNSSSNRPTKISKHKRTWSMSSDNSTGGGNRSSQEDDLQNKLQALQDMFTSTRPSSILYLKGEEMDDMDLHPVQLVGGDVPELTKQESTESSKWERQNSSTSVLSPTPSSLSLQPPDRRVTDLPRSHFNPPSRVTSDEWPSLSQTAISDMGPPGSQFTSPTQVVKVARRGTTGSLGGWIDAVGVDPNYQPPPEPVIKPVACFYFQSSFNGRAAESSLYRAIYPVQRSLKELVYRVASKSNVESSRILQVVRVTKANLEVVMDDEMVTELPEGQDFIAEFVEVHSAVPMKQEWTGVGPHEVLVDGDINPAQAIQTSGYSLRLHY